MATTVYTAVVKKKNLNDRDDDDVEWQHLTTTKTTVTLTSDDQEYDDAEGDCKDNCAVKDDREDEILREQERKIVC